MTKVIQAMKRIKENKEKISDLQEKIHKNAAHMSIEKLEYDEPAEKVEAWVRSCLDLSQENVRLLTAIARTNLATEVTIDIGDNQIKKTIAEWVWRRREYAALDYATIGKLTDRGMKDATIQNSAGGITEVKVIRNYNPLVRDARMEEFRSEPHRIDAALEVINAVTDLVE